MKQAETIRTKDLYLVAYLLQTGYPIRRVESDKRVNNGPSTVFVLSDSGLHHAASHYEQGQATVNVAEYTKCLEHVKQQMFSHNKKKGRHLCTSQKTSSVR